MNAKLIAKGSEQVIEIRSAETVVGRAGDCAVRIPSGLVSRRHCVLSFHDGALTVEDLGSSNGTFLNGKRVKKKHLVHPGDQLEIGPVTLTVDYKLSDTAVGAERAARSNAKELAQAEELEELEVEELAESAASSSLEELAAMESSSQVEELDVIEDTEEGSAESQAPTVNAAALPARSSAKGKPSGKAQRPAKAPPAEEEEGTEPAGPSGTNPDERLKIDDDDFLEFLGDPEDDSPPAEHPGHHRS